MEFLRKILCFFVFIIPGSLFAQASESLPSEVRNVGIENRLGSYLSLDLKLTDEVGLEVPLKNFFRNQNPVLVVIVYYGCPTLCNFILNYLSDHLRNVELTVGKDFEIVVISMNPSETFELAKKKKDAYVAAYDRKNTDHGWHFLTGKEGDIQKVTKNLGFKYQYDPTSGEYNHPSVIYVLTPEGRIANVLDGLSYKQEELVKAIKDAALGNVNLSLFERFVLLCYQYDPASGSYRVTRVMKFAAFFTVVLIGFFMIFSLRKKRN